MELNENILELENSVVNETEDYNDFVNRRRNNKKSIRTKVTTLMENGEVHSEVMGTKISEEELNSDLNIEKNEESKSSADGSNDNEVVSNIENNNNDNNINGGNTESPKKDNVEPNAKKDNDTKSKSDKDEDRTVLGMKPIYGYSLITIISLVAITAAVKIFKNNKKIQLTT